MRPSVIAIDGPASSGKSTIGHALAEYLGYAMLDSGLVYRLIAGQVLQGKVTDPSDDDILRIAQTTLSELHIERGPNGAHLIFRSQPLAELDLHIDAISAFVPLVGRVPSVRALVREVQRRIIASGPTIIAGRDIGTVVAPSAELKLYLDVSLEERVARRQWAPEKQHSAASHAEIERAIQARDQMDRERSVSPLAVSPDAVVICTDRLTVEETLEIIRQMCELSTGSGEAPAKISSWGQPGLEGLDRPGEKPSAQSAQSRPARRSTQFVVGGYAVQSGRVLLMWHTELGRWVPPGGRIAMPYGEYPHEAVVRGVKAECGLDVSIDFESERDSPEDIASSVPAPVAMQEIRLASGEYYLDMIYFCQVAGGAVTLDYQQARAYHWFDSDDLRRYPLMPHVQKFALRALSSVTADMQAPDPTYVDV